MGFKINDRVNLKIANKDECLVVNKHIIEGDPLYSVIKWEDYKRMNKDPFFEPRTYNLNGSDLTYTKTFLRKKKIEKILTKI